MTTPRFITPKELAVGQHVQVRYDYDQHRATVHEGLVEEFDSESVTLKGDAWHWAVNQPEIDVTITLLAEPT